MLRAGSDIWFLLSAVRSARYLVMFVLLMLWTRIILIAIERAMSTNKGFDDKRVQHSSSTTVVSGEESHENAVTDGSLENKPKRNGEDTRSTQQTSATTKTHPDQFLSNDAIPHFAGIVGIHKYRDPSCISQRILSNTEG